ncbi:hypothetical protein FJ934_20890 [Mesorhizobium sp. B2-4-12]|uniref:peroxidase family protein n=1 Tax=Mesorhizobium sp. B2-4-12 TaxID=2589937 RepID=UPI0011272913|nr:peroxidase family protein [Mesorhizobium sp. B2-4-12]TPK92269.1 hypothetical protein FJ934_20890 [Mesorhizobium sp. B2-4-12]
MPSIKPFDITLSDINFLLDQMRDAIFITGYDASGQAIYGYTDAGGTTRTLGLFGTFDPLGIIDPTTHLSIYDGAREASGFRIPVGFFNNLVEVTRWKWGSSDNPFPRLTAADYNNYVAQVMLNPALTNGFHTGYLDTHTLPDTTQLASPGAYGDLNTTVVDYTPRMITQTISSSYGAPGAATATGIVLAGTDPAIVSMLPGELMIVSTGAGLVAFSFYIGADPSNGNLVGINVNPPATVASAMQAMQVALRDPHIGGVPDAVVAIDANGHISMSLGSPQDGSFAVFDYAGLGLGGTFDPVVPDSASAMIRTGVYTDVVTSENVHGVGGTTETITEYMVRNLNTLPGDPSTSGIFTLFGQFFDHGLDFIGKGGQGSKIIIPLSPSDPLYRAPMTNGPSDPGNTTITISRATPDGYTVDDYHGRPISIAGADNVWGTPDDLSAPGADGVYGTGDDVHAAMVKPATTSYTNHTSPYIDQSQSYGSDSQTTYILREWVKDPNNPGHYIAGAELLDGHQTQAYTSQYFDDSSLTGLGVGQTTRTLPTLNELREHLRATMRDDLTWDDINNLRARDAQGHVIDTNGSVPGGFNYTGEALLLDMNPRFDIGRLHPNDGNAGTNWDTNAAAKVDTAIATLSQWVSNNGLGSFGLVGNDLTLTLNAAMGPLQANVAYTGAYAMALWVDFSNFSITATDDIYGAVSEIMMASVGDHYVAGDGRANENFGLTAIHHVFHANHNVQLINLEKMVLASPDIDARHGYEIAVTQHSGDVVANGISLINGHYEDANHNYTLADGSISWNQDKMFEAAKLINEMEYQHVAIDQYARLVTPDLPEFVTYDNDIKSDISLEYSQAAFRFGHSQLRETIDAIDPNSTVTKWALEAAFLNPTAYAQTGAEDILRGMSQQLTNEVDEFVTPAMQQTLLGQPLDLAAINIARGRDVGMPTLNEVRRQLHDALVAERLADPATPHHTNLIVDALNPYTSWAEFGSQMQHPESLVNFIAAYSFDGDLAKARAIVGLEDGSISEGTPDAMNYTLQQAVAFLNGGDDGYNHIDFWMGGLAELHVFTGQLGTTFNAIFEDQMERLMDGDRFYYLYRLGLGLNIDPDLGHAITTEQFKDIIERTTGALHLNGDVMGWSDHTFELAPMYLAALAATAGMTNGFKIDPVTHAVTGTSTATGYGIYSGSGNSTAGNGTLLTKINADLGLSNTYIADFRPDVGENPDGTPSSGYNSHETFAGTDYNDWLDAGNGDDTIYGDKGNDVLDGKAGADHIYGGDGQDVIYGGDIEDFLDGGAGDDIIYAGTSAGGLDVAIGGHGNDRVYGEAGIDELYGGEGDDYIDAGGDTDLAFGDSGNDIMFGGDGPDELRGGEGDDMLSGGSGSDQLKGEHGDDIFFGGIGQAAQTGDSDEALGDTGFDMAAFSDTSIVLDTAADLRNVNLTGAPGGTAFEPFNQLWTDLEGVVGSKFGDTIIGADSGAVDAEGVQSGDNWLIGGGGNDTFGTRVGDETGSLGNGGDDVIVGDSVRLDALIGHYSGYLEDHPELPQFDANGNALHGLLNGDTTLTGGLLGHGEAAGFAKHFTEMLKTHDRKDLVLGADVGAAGDHDVAIYTGNVGDYTLTALDANGAIVANPHANWGNVFAVKIHDDVGDRTLADGTVLASDGTDLLVGVEYLDFANDHNFNIQAYFDIAPTLDLHYAPTARTVRDTFGTSNSSSYTRNDGTTNWNGSWQESGDINSSNNGASGGAIRLVDTQAGNGQNWALQFDRETGASGDGASISRGVDLSGATTTTSGVLSTHRPLLTFDLTKTGIGSGETLQVQYSSNGTTWTTVATYGDGSNSTSNATGGQTIDLSGQVLSADSAIRFVVSQLGNSSDYFHVDNVQVAFNADADGVNYSTNYTEQLTPAAIASTPLITDPDDTNMVSAKIVLTDGVVGDRLNVGVLPSGIVATGNGTGLVTLTGAATLAAYRTALEAITFSNPTNDNPTGANRHIQVTVSDGLKNSPVATTTVHVTPLDDPATLHNDTILTNNGTTSFTVPDWALLANDSDPDSVLSISGVNGGSELANGSPTHSNSNQSVTIQDSTSGQIGGYGGTFRYYGSGVGSNDVGRPTVTVSNQNGGNLTGTAGSEIIVDSTSGTGVHTINGNGGNDIVFANNGDDTIVTGSGNDYIDGGTGADSMTGGAGDDTYVIDDVSGTRDVVHEDVGGGTDTITSSNSSLNLNDSAFANVENATLTGSSSLNIVGNSANNVLVGNGGNNIFTWNALGGRDTIDGGSGSGDTFVVNGNASAETFDIYAMTDGQNAGLASLLGTSFATDTEIVITRTVSGVTTVAAELDNIDEITVNTLNVTANNNNGGPDGGPTGGDTVVIHGNFAATDLNYSTITVNGGDSDDTVDISGLTSDHRIVFHGAGGTNHVIGDLRPQDVVDNGVPGNGNAPGNGGDTSQGDDDDEDDNEHQNRAPVVNGAIVLPPLGANTAMLITAATLLAGASDADGDSLTVTNLTPSSGTVTQGPDGWTFTSDTDTSQVSFSYDISDGQASVHQTASLDLTAAAEGEGDGGDAPVPGGDAHLGTDGDDVMIGGPDADVLSGGQGDDVILGNDGADTLLGGAGDDLIKAGAGDDVVFGGAGNDNIFGGAGHDTIFGDGGNDRIFADEGNDVVEGGAGNDTVYAGTGDDHIIANVGDGDDVYWGEDGQDTLDYAAIGASLTIDLGNGLLHHGSVSSAQSGQDTVFGFENVIAGSGNDTIIANAAANTMDGGLGSDTFVFGSAADANGDTIVGLQPGDKIDLSLIDADTSAAGHQSFVLFAGAGFTSAGQVMVSYQTAADGEHTLVKGEINGDGAADFSIDVAGHHDLDGTSFKFA